MSIEFCSLASGSSGNAQFIGCGDTNLLLDAGLSGKYIQSALVNVDIDIRKIRGILITHEHSDHIKGVGILHRKYGMEIYTTKKTWEAMETKLGKINEEKVVFFEPNVAFQIGSIMVEPFSISHDAVDPVAFSFKSHNSKLSMATDLGIWDESILNEIKDSDLLILESNHDIDMLKMGSYPYYLKRRILSEVGHLSNESAGELITRVVKDGRVKNILLAHLSKENNHPELAYETVKEIVEKDGIRVGVDINIDLTYRDRVGKIYKIKPD